MATDLERGCSWFMKLRDILEVEIRSPLCDPITVTCLMESYTKMDCDPDSRSVLPALGEEGRHPQLVKLRA